MLIRSPKKDGMPVRLCDLDGMAVTSLCSSELDGVLKLKAQQVHFEQLLEGSVGREQRNLIETAVRRSFVRMPDGIARQIVDGG